LEACEREPLAHSGLIQDVGVLLHIDRSSGLIDFVSENANLLLGDDPSQLVGADGRAWIQDFLPDIGELPAAAGRRVFLERALDLGFGELDVLISATASGWLIELERFLERVVDPSNHRLLAVPEPIEAAALAAAQQDLVDRIAEVTGYDRVMLYEFKGDWSGEVLAEKVTRSAGTYLGLRFPASDIPAIARALYAQMPYRHIPDVAREPIAILGASRQASTLDLTWSDLRSVSPVHREYLRNMQVGASFSVSVMVEGKLWGLIACHHPEALTVPVAARIRCQDLVSQHVSTLMSYRRRTQTAELERLDVALAPLGNVPAGADITRTFQDLLADLSRLLDAEAGAVVVDDRVASSRAGDDRERLRQIHGWCVANQSASVSSFEHLPEAWLPSSGTSSTSICGMLSIGVRARRHGNRLVGFYFFRPEEAVEIAWAGSPEKPLEVTSGLARLSPRHSFEKWVEVRTGYSRPWDPLTLFTATQLHRRLESIL
jgi:light-regulated signal transduction histidine kinase (bacteriophytochrome)